MVEEIQVKKKGKKTRNNAAFEKINAVKVGDFIVLKNEEWEMGTLPGAHIIRRRLGREFKVETLKDETGWVITALS
jgi:hypothetical protein